MRSGSRSRTRYSVRNDAPSGHLCSATARPDIKHDQADVCSSVPDRFDNNDDAGQTDVDALPSYYIATSSQLARLACEVPVVRSLTDSVDILG
jgi:hypothetical protein